MEPLTTADLHAGFLWLAERDNDLAAVVAKFGMPPLWERPQGFPTLVHIILEQQVSLASAKAAFDRLCVTTESLSPQRFMELNDVTLKAIGFSRQKTGYVRHLSQALLNGGLDLEGLSAMEDEVARAELVSVKGIGMWTANIYLLMALLRPDVLPHGDRALAVAVQRVKRLPVCPNDIELEAISQPWRPWRSAAVRIFWQFYLNGGLKDPQWQIPVL